MSGLISIDPGVKALGWATWGCGGLERAGLSRTIERDLGRAIAGHLANLEDIGPCPESAVEHMTYRPTDSTPQDLINVEAVGCAVGCSKAHRMCLYTPSTWKGSIPKYIHHARIVDVLSDNETRTLDWALRGCPKGHRKEILDAVGIGLYHLRRTNRSGGARL